MFWLRYVILCLSCGILRCLNLCLFLQLSLVNCAIVSAVSACLPISVCGYFPSFIFLAGKVLNSLILTLYSQLPHDHRRVRHSKILWTFLFPTFSNKDNLDTFFYTKSAQKKIVLAYLAFCFLVWILKDISQVPTLSCVPQNCLIVGLFCFPFSFSCT